MRAPVYLVCAALVVAVRTEENIPAYFGKQMESRPSQTQEDQLNPLQPDEGTMGYLIPRLLAKYRPSRQWNPRYIDPRLLLLTEAETNNFIDQLPAGPEGRIKRTSLQDRPSLSITNSLDVLRNRLLLEISRKKAMEGVNRNRDLLCKIGKRALFNTKNCEDEFLD